MNRRMNHRSSHAFVFVLLSQEKTEKFSELEAAVMALAGKPVFVFIAACARRISCAERNSKRVGIHTVYTVCKIPCKIQCILPYGYKAILWLAVPS